MQSDAVNHTHDRCHPQTLVLSTTSVKIDKRVSYKVLTL